MNNEMWNFVQKHLGYSDEEMELFKSNPRNSDVLLKAPELMNKTIVRRSWNRTVVTASTKRETSSSSTAPAT